MCNLLTLESSKTRRRTWHNTNVYYDYISNFSYCNLSLNIAQMLRYLDIVFFFYIASIIKFAPNQRLSAMEDTSRQRPFLSNSIISLSLNDPFRTQINWRSVICYHCGSIMVEGLVRKFFSNLACVYVCGCVPFFFFCLAITF